MEDEGDVLAELLELDVPQLGCIDDLMNNIINDHEVPLNNIDTRKLGGEVLDQLGFDQAVAETNNEGFDQLGFDQLGLEMINNDVGPVDAAAISNIPADGNISGDNLVSDSIFAPRKIRKKPCPWTEQEQRQFRKAIVKGLWGKWKQVSKLYIPSKTPSQITSHAQKYANRKNNTHKKRKSINDDDDHDHTYDDQPITVLPPTRSDGSHDHVNHHQHVHIHDPSSSSSSSLSMVDYQMMSPLQVQSQSSTPTSNHMHGNGMMMMNYDMPPPAAYDNAAAIYYANKCLHLEKQILNLRREMMMTMHPINAQLFPGASYSTSNASTFGVINQPLQPYVGSSSSHVHHDAYFNAPLDHQVLQPQPLVQQITHPSSSSSGR